MGSHKMGMRRKVYAWKNEKKRFPPFSEFVKYVVVETDIACDPMNLSQQKTEIYSRGPRRQRDYGNFRRTPRESNRDEFARSLATKVNEEDASKGKTEEVQCAMCGKAHELESCMNYSANHDISSNANCHKNLLNLRNIG
jgi:hypothetical protein